MEAKSEIRRVFLAISSHYSYNNDMVTVGIKNLKDSLSRYLKLVREGERVVVTDHNRVIAEIIPASTAATSGEKERSTQKQIEKIYEQTRSERQ